jgi:hypothetical protein
MQDDLSRKMHARAEIIRYVFLFRCFDGLTVENIKTMMITIRFQNVWTVLTERKRNLTVAFLHLNTLGIRLDERLPMLSIGNNLQLLYLVTDEIHERRKLRLVDRTLVSRPNAVKRIFGDTAGINGHLLAVDKHTVILGDRFFMIEI